MVDKKKAVAGAYFQRCYKWEGAISFSIIKKTFRIYHQLIILHVMNRAAICTIGLKSVNIQWRM